MRSELRITVVTLAAFSLLVHPALASSDSGLRDVDEGSCVVTQPGQTGLRALLTPGTPLMEDVAFNHGDPDAERNPLELIRFPDEAEFWRAAGVTPRDALMVGTATSVPTVQTLGFVGAERWDAEISDSVVRLYCALFDRLPAAHELEYWVTRYRSGLPLVTIAEAFTHAQEFVGRNGVVSDSGFVVFLFRHVLDREPSLGTVEHFSSLLEEGAQHRGQIVVRVTESAEYVLRTGTVSPAKPILPYPDVGSGRRIIYADREQRVWLVNGTGELEKTHQVTGRRGVPGVGRYRIFSMSRFAWAPYDGITMEHMVRFARGEWPYGFHSIPIHPNKKPLQSPARLGTHGSGGCVRQLWHDAEALFEWSSVGTRVIVIP